MRSVSTVKAMPPYGMARTELTPDDRGVLRRRDRPASARPCASPASSTASRGSAPSSRTAPDRARQVEPRPERSRNAPGASCGCGRKMRMHASRAGQGPGRSAASAAPSSRPEPRCASEVEHDAEPSNGRRLVPVLDGARRSRSSDDQRLRETLERRVGDASHQPSTTRRPGSTGRPARSAERLDRIEAADRRARTASRPTQLGRTVDDRHASDGRLQRWYAALRNGQRGTDGRRRPSRAGASWRSARGRCSAVTARCAGPTSTSARSTSPSATASSCGDHREGGPPPGTLGSVVSVDQTASRARSTSPPGARCEVDRDSERSGRPVARLRHPRARPQPSTRSLALQAERERAMALELEP